MDNKSKFTAQRVPVTNELSRNTVLDQGGYHISHEGSSGAYGCPTTALVFRNTLFFVLEGDHREGYAQAVDDNGKQGAFEYFVEHIHQAHKYSEHTSVDNDPDRFGLGRVAREELGEENIVILRTAIEALAPPDTEDDGMEP